MQTHPRTQYKMQDLKRKEINQRNIQIKQNFKPLNWGEFKWFGFASDYAPSQIPAGHGTTSLNLIPTGTGLEKPFGFGEVGFHSNDYNPSEWVGVTGGKIELEEPALGFTSDTNMFKIVRRRSSLGGEPETKFFFLDKTGFWQDYTPRENTYIEDGEDNWVLNENATQFYNFKGSIFDYAVWKNVLYICSGEEEFLGSDGRRHGLMVWDGQNWDSIDTGNVGFIRRPQDYKNKTALDADGNYADASYRLYDAPDEFNPSLITIFKERVLISGAKHNRVQVKLSEWNNPDNFVDNVLGLQTAILETKDTARASSFVISTGINRITSLDAFNDKVYIGSDKGFYIYDLVKQQIDTGFFQLDALVQNNYTPAGPISNLCSVGFQNKLFFVADFQTIPEISAHVLSGEGTTYTKLSSDIDDFMSKLDLTKSCIGIYGEHVLIGARVGYEATEGINDVTIVATPFAVSEGVTKWGFSILNYMQPSFFFQNARGCYVLSSREGSMYRVVPNKFTTELDYKDEYGQVKLAPQPSATWQTGWTGLDIRKDSRLAKKRLEKFVVTGYFSEGTVMYITFIVDKDCGQRDDEANNCVESKTIKYVIKSKDSGDCQDAVDAILTPDIKAKNRAKYKTLFFDFPIGIDSIMYQALSIRIDVLDSRYFLIETITGSSEVQSIDMNDSIQPVFASYEEIEGLSIGGC